MQMWLSKLVSTAQTLVNVSFTETQDRDRLYLLVFIDDQKDIQQLCATDITVFSKMQPSQQLRNCLVYNLLPSDFYSLEMILRSLDETIVELGDMALK